MRKLLINREYINLVPFISIILSVIGLASSYFTIQPKFLPYKGGVAIYKLTETTEDDLVFSLQPSPSPSASSGKSSSPEIGQASKYPNSPITLSRKNLVFSQTPVYLVWMMIFCIMVGAAFSLVAPIIKEIILLLKFFVKPAHLGIYITLALITCIPLAILIFCVSHGETTQIMSAFKIIDTFGVMLEDTIAVQTFTGITIFIGCLPILGMLIVNFCIPSLDEKNKERSADEKSTIDKFMQLHAALKFFLTTCAVLIMFSVLTTSFIQQSLEKSVTLDGHTLFPSEFVYAYGLVFTIFLAAVYLPIDYHLRTKGKTLFTTLTQDHPETAPPTLNKLNLKESGLKNLQVIFTILSPLLGSVFSETIKNFL